MDLKTALLRGAAILLAAVFALFFLRFLLPVLLPFLVGGGVAVLLRPLARGIAGVTHMRPKPSAAAACLLFYGGFCLLVASLGFLLFAQTVSFFSQLPDFFQTTILPTANQLWSSATQLIEGFLPQAGGYMQQLSEWFGAAAGEALSQISAAALHWTAGFAGRLPANLLGLFMGVLSSFLILMDYEQVSAFLFRLLPPAGKKLVRSSKRFLLSTVKKVVKAYLLLMLITWAEVTLGLWLLGVEYFAVLGIVVALVDILPVLGSGSVLVPWGLWLLLFGNAPQGVGILLLYGVVTVVHTIAEPHILGEGLGLHPLATLVAMYAGMRLFGVIGLVAAPMVATLLVYLSKQGQLHFRKGWGDKA